MLSYLVSKSYSFLSPNTSFSYFVQVSPGIPEDILPTPQYAPPNEFTTILSCIISNNDLAENVFLTFGTQPQLANLGITIAPGEKYEVNLRNMVLNTDRQLINGQIYPTDGSSIGFTSLRLAVNPLGNPARIVHTWFGLR